MAVERWLQDGVAAVYNAMQRDPSRAIPAAQVFAMIRAHHATRVRRDAPEEQAGVPAP